MLGLSTGELVAAWLNERRVGSPSAAPYGGSHVTRALSYTLFFLSLVVIILFSGCFLLLVVGPDGKPVITS